MRMESSIEGENPANRSFHILGNISRTARLTCSSSNSFKLRKSVHLPVAGYLAPMNSTTTTTTITTSKPARSEPVSHNSSAPHCSEVVSRSRKDERQILLLIRLLYVTYYMAVGCLQPFLPVYYHSLGYGGRFIGLLGAITPFVTFVVGPIWGMISDRTGRPFCVLYVTIVVSLAGHVLIAPLNDPRHIVMMVFLTACFSAPVKSLIDSLVIENLSDRKEYGKMRLWSLVGTGVATSVAGSFLDTPAQNGWPVSIEDGSITDYLALCWESLTGYKLLFFAHAVLHIPALLCIRRFQTLYHGRGMVDGKVKLGTEPTKASLGIMDVAGFVFRDAKASLFFLLVFALAVPAGLGENFGYVRFRELGFSGSEMGISRLLCSISGAIMFWYSGSLSAWLGIEKVMILSFLGYGLRFTLVVIMDHPFHGYLSEIVRGMLFGCFWSAATVYASQIAPKEVRATMLQFLNGVYNGIGRSTGALVGGWLQAELGTVRTFMYSAILNVVLAMLLFAFTNLRQVSGLAKQFQKNATDKKRQ